MRLSFALFADAANLSQEGKLNVLGVFDAVQVAGLPTVHPRAHLVVRIKGGVSDVGTHVMTLRWVNPSGSELWVSNGELNIGAPPPGVTDMDFPLIAAIDLPLDAPGTYAMQVALGSCTIEDVALSAVATVVSVPAPDRFVLDAGSKTLGADVNGWARGYGLVPGYPGAVITQLSEHHAVVSLPLDTRSPRLGDRVAVIPNHVCNAVNLADELFVVRDGHLVDRWPVAARGKNA